MKKLIISENEKNNILNKYYTKLSLNELDYAGDTGKGTTTTTTTVAPQQQQAPAKNYTIQELQQLLGVKADGYAGPNTLAALEKALQSKGTLPAATTTNAAQPTAEKPKDLSATPVQTKTATNIDTKTNTVTTKNSNTQQAQTGTQQAQTGTQQAQTGTQAPESDPAAD